jgi:hypothetical protein
LVEIVYGAAAPCGGAGHWVLNSTGAHIPGPTHVILFHEMTHARSLVSGTYNPATAEAVAIAQENEYRAAFGLPQRSGHKGGCNPPLSAPGPSSKCFIATAAFGSAMEPQVQMLRSFRDDILLKTRAGARFFEEFYGHYYNVSPTIVAAMNDDPAVKELVRWSVVTPIVRYLELMLAFPEASTATVEEPWRSFLDRMRDDLEVWASEIDLPVSFDNADLPATAAEIGIILRYVLRSDEKRVGYLTDLERRGAIPLTGPPAEVRRAAAELCRYAPQAQFARRVLPGLDSKEPERAAAQYMNADEVIDASSLPSAVGDWIYQVVVTNLSGNAFDQIALFYNQIDAPNAVVALVENSVQNGQVVTFNLGPCGLLMSYVIGFFVGSDEVATIPNSDPIFQGQTDITPALDQQIHPNDPPCASGWAIS